MRCIKAGWDVMAEKKSEGQVTWPHSSSKLWTTSTFEVLIWFIKGTLNLKKKKKLQTDHLEKSESKVIN